MCSLVYNTHSTVCQLPIVCSVYALIRICPLQSHIGMRTRLSIFFPSNLSGIDNPHAHSMRPERAKEHPNRLIFHTPPQKAYGQAKGVFCKSGNFASIWIWGIEQSCCWTHRNTIAKEWSAARRPSICCTGGIHPCFSINTKVWKHVWSSKS